MSEGLEAAMSSLEAAEREAKAAEKSVREAEERMMRLSKVSASKTIVLSFIFQLSVIVTSCRAPTT